MNDFPVIETIDDVRPFVEGRDEFVIAQRSWGTVIDYQITLPDSFATPQARECRGIKFAPDGTLLARPYHKFFNFGEPLMQVADLAAAGRFHEHFIILDKLDGSMIHPIIWAGQVFFCTRMGLTSVAEQAEEYAKSFGYKSNSGFWNERTEGPWYLDFCFDLAQSGMTPMFEWCSRKQRIVLDYPEDQLVLTGIRVNRTGEYLTYGKMKALAIPYSIPLVQHWEGEWEDIHAFLEMVHSIEESEGFVLRWDNGQMGKTKGQWYLQIHKAKDHITHEKRIIGLILNDKLDDVLPFLLPGDYERVVAYRDDFWANIEEKADTLTTVVTINQQLPDEMGLDRKTGKGMFAKTVATGYVNDLKPWKGLLFARWDEKASSREIIIGYLRKQFALDVVGAKANGTDATVQELRAALLLPEKDWRDY